MRTSRGRPVTLPPALGALETWKHGRACMGIRQAVQRTHSGRCALCGTDCRGAFEIDHVRRRSEGGTDDRANMRPLCPTCHRERHGPFRPDRYASRPRRALERRTEPRIGPRPTVSPRARCNERGDSSRSLERLSRRPDERQAQGALRQSAAPQAGPRGPACARPPDCWLALCPIMRPPHPN
jgi:hypothetical protein